MSVHSRSTRYALLRRQLQLQSLLPEIKHPFAHTLLALIVTLLTGSAGAQITADLHTSAEPRVILPAQGERRILPDGRSIRLKVGPATTGAGYLFLGDEELPPGSRVPRHRHELDEEVLIVLVGEVTFLLNDSARVAPAGSVVYLPPRNWIAVENRGSAPARVMFAFPRGAVERCFQFIGRSEADSAAGRSPMRGAAESIEERHSCQMTYRTP
jgi:mannose-6-phosphate isomerase-like protein (cupin superfamily)